jgi:hypothetical protein
MRMVSGSRISPTTMTSGDWRTADRRAVAKSGASMPTSTCSMTLRWWGCSYSIGSSMVTMCFASLRLITSTSAATVVVLPDPVAPPMRTKPCGILVRASMPGGSASSPSCGGCRGSARMLAAARPRSRCRLIRNRPLDPRRNDASAQPVLRYCSIAYSGSIGRTFSSISSPSRAGFGNLRTTPWILIAGAIPATR